MSANEGEMMRGGKMICDRRKRGAVAKKNAADELQISGLMKLIQTYTFQLVINSLFLLQFLFLFFYNKNYAREGCLLKCHRFRFDGC